LNGTLRLWPVWLLACASLVHADDTHTAAKKPDASATSSASEPVAADAELLEFLGSVDEEADGEWIDYLSKTDISKAAKANKEEPVATDASSE
jgi:hypothetical protein